jgi:hypothetical protein
MGTKLVFEIGDVKVPAVPALISIIGELNWQRSTVYQVDLSSMTTRVRRNFCDHRLGSLFGQVNEFLHFLPSDLQISENTRRNHCENRQIP